MRVLITGAGGMLGRAVVEEYEGRGADVAALPRTELDVTDPDGVKQAFDRFAPQIVIHCAAYTAVDQAESEPEAASRVNGVGAGFVARECQRTGSIFVYPSTDYVFSGESRRPWRSYDRPDPVNAYGRSKLAGEQAAMTANHALVVRTSWLYGRGGRNFVDVIGELAREREEIEVVDDQVGSPTWTVSLAWVIASLVDAGARGIFHASGSGDGVSWCDFASEIVKLNGLATRVRPVPTAAFPRPARRPRYSVLDCGDTERLLGRELPHWRGMLRDYFCESNDRRENELGSCREFVVRDVESQH